MSNNPYAYQYNKKWQPPSGKSISIDNEPIPKELAQDILPMFRVKKDTSKKKKTKSLKKVGKKGETEVEKKRREARDLRLRRFLLRTYYMN